MDSNVILTELQNSGVYRFASLAKLENSTMKCNTNNILISRKKPGKVITVEHFHRIRNNFKVEEEPKTSEDVNVAIKHLKLSKRDRITILSNENKIIHQQTDTGHQTVYKITTPDDLSLTSEPFPIKKPKRIRAKREKKSPVSNSLKVELPVEKCTAKTRSGRLLTKAQFVDSLDIEKQTFNEMINDLKDTEYKCSNKPKEIVAGKEKRKRKVNPDFKCATCGKIFLGKRMLKHYLTYPEHKIQVDNRPKLDLYSFLVDKVKSFPENIRTEIFLNELSNFISKLQELSSRLIQNTTGMHFVNQNLSKVLGIPEGCYSLDIAALYSNNNIFQEAELPEYNSLSNISLNLSSDHIIPQSEESLLKTVDDLMKEGIKKLNSFDHHAITDNAVEAENIMKSSVKVTTEEVTSSLPPAAPSLMDLSLDVDMFQFKNP